MTFNTFQDSLSSAMICCIHCRKLKKPYHEIFDVILNVSLQRMITLFGILHRGTSFLYGWHLHVFLRSHFGQNKLHTVYKNLMFISSVLKKLYLFHNENINYASSFWFFLIDKYNSMLRQLDTFSEPNRHMENFLLVTSIRDLNSTHKRFFPPPYPIMKVSL